MLVYNYLIDLEITIHSLSLAIKVIVHTIDEWFVQSNTFLNLVIPLTFPVDEIQMENFISYCEIKDKIPTNLIELKKKLILWGIGATKIEESFFLYNEVSRQVYFLTEDLHQLILNGARRSAKHRDKAYVDVKDIKFYWSLLPDLLEFNANDFLINSMFGDISKRLEYINYPDELSDIAVRDKYYKINNRFKKVIHQFFKIYKNLNINLKDLFIFQSRWGFQ